MKLIRIGRAVDREEANVLELRGIRTRVHL